MGEIRKFVAVDGGAGEEYEEYRRELQMAMIGLWMQISEMTRDGEMDDLILVYKHNGEWQSSMVLEDTSDDADFMAAGALLRAANELVSD